jgi:hypothetical protein
MGLKIMHHSMQLSTKNVIAKLSTATKVPFIVRGGCKIPEMAKMDARTKINQRSHLGY